VVGASKGLRYGSYVSSQERKKVVADALSRINTLNDFSPNYKKEAVERVRCPSDRNCAAWRSGLYGSTPSDFPFGGKDQTATK